MWLSDFPYRKGLLLKVRIRSLFEQILSFKRSSHFEKDAIENITDRYSSLPFDVRNLSSSYICFFCSLIKGISSKFERLKTFLGKLLLSLFKSFFLSSETVSMA